MSNVVVGSAELGERIMGAPATTTLEILGAVLGPEAVGKMTIRNGVRHGNAAPVAEEINLRDAGPFVDETTVPLFDPGDDSASVFESAAADEWMEGQLALIAKA